jgi:hypothetical protein
VDVTLLIFSEKGELVNEAKVASGDTKIWRNIRSGMYFFRVMNSKNGQQIREHKQVILK